MSRFLTAIAVGTVLQVAPLSALAQPGPDGFDWVTIGAVGNRPWDRGEVVPGTMVGRGSVGYEYRISRMETTTAQWMEFHNTFSARSDAPDWLEAPLNWGARPDPTYDGPGTRYVLSSAYQNPAMHAVTGISWRDAARFCNWLHNDKSPELWSTENGAYDTSTFADVGTTFTDQLTRSPGARYWIPSLDEWLKAAHYDAATDYWFQYSNGMDRASIGRPPGEGEANTGFSFPFGGQLHIPLGSYPQTLSPWGLLDTSGSSSEMTEGLYSVPSVGDYRVVKGAHFGSDPAGDDGRQTGGVRPSGRGLGYGVRIASVPGPSACAALLCGAAFLQRRRPPAGR